MQQIVLRFFFFAKFGLWIKFIMPAGFSFIEQYRSMAKDLEQQSCDEMLDFDQEVPDADFKPEIKYEAVISEADLFSIMTGVTSSNSDATDTTVSQSFPNFMGVSNHKTNNFLGSIDTQNKFTAVSSAPTSTLSTSSLLQSSSSPWLSSATRASPFPNSSSPNSILTSTKTSTYVTELGASGCTVVSNVDFLQDPPSVMPPFASQDDSRDYIDLDKQESISLYDDYDAFSVMSKHGLLSDESSSVPLEEAVFLMTDTIQADCENLNVPFDPSLWTTEHVQIWISWVCRKNAVPDISRQLMNIDGQTLCTFHSDMLSRTFGDSGIKISNELALLKAANSCFPNQLPQTNCPYMENVAFNITPSVSPAPSFCSSIHDSSTSTLSTPSDHSDDESGYGSQMSSMSEKANFTRISPKISGGRGHKQTIHLWQFLKELLLSKDTNYSDCIRWLDRKSGVFKIEDSKKVASLWGARKNRPAMNYDKLSRSVRQYYKKGIIKKTEQSKRLVYQFCEAFV